MDLGGAVAVVTGGASGIGEETARLLAKSGARVAVVDRNAERGRDVAASIAGLFVAADVSDPKEWLRITDEVTTAWGPITLAHLNAGVPTRRYPYTVEEVTDDQYQRIVGVNLGGVLFGVRAVVPSMTGAGGGAIVATASMAGLVAFPADPVYAATKHGVVAFVRSAAPQLSRLGIRINVVCPSATDTPILDDERRADIARNRRPLQPAGEVAVAVVDLLAGGDTGGAWTTKLGRSAQRWRFPDDPR
jgi:NAD(P)-dependent dehydrogenase (short-subunit alcohol dehydrogenase family)